MEDNRLKKLTDRLEQTETQSDYYKKIAIEAGKTHLQEAEHLSSIIQSYKQIVSDLEKQIADRKSAEDTVKESHQLLLTILNSIDASIFVADMDTYRILFANDFMINNFGKEIVGKNALEFSGKMIHLATFAPINNWWTIKIIHRGWLYGKDRIQ